MTPNTRTLPLRTSFQAPPPATGSSEELEEGPADKDEELFLLKVDTSTSPDSRDS